MGPLNASKSRPPPAERDFRGLAITTLSNDVELRPEPRTQRPGLPITSNLAHDMPHSIPVESEVPGTREFKMEEDAVVDADADAQLQPPSEEDVDMADADPEPTSAAENSRQEDRTGDASNEDKQEKEEVKLEDLFADADSDDEFPSSRPADGTPSSSSPGEATPTSR